MKYLTLTKLAAVLSVVLFCIGIGFYGFTRMSFESDDRETDLSAFVPDDCVGAIEVDNIDNFINEFPSTAYAEQLDTIRKSGLVKVLWEDLNQYSQESAHALSTQISHMMISIHMPEMPQNLVAYFAMGEEGRKLFLQTIRRKHRSAFTPRKETYRGKRIEVFPLEGGEYLAVYNGDDFLAISYQKRLIEKVIDALKDGSSLRKDPAFSAVHHEKETNYVTFYARTPSLPLLADAHTHCWSTFHLHLNSEVFYLAGVTNQPDSCYRRMTERLHHLPFHSEDSLLMVQGKSEVDSCIAAYSMQPHSLFNECVTSLSPEASFILVADMDKVNREPQRFRDYLPPFIRQYPELFRSFILSVQLKEVDTHFSHIVVLTYKE